jgi:uncharacterized protein (DUF1697 family)
MNRFIALLRAVNVGGTGKLPMADLRAMAEAEGFAAVRTYIASGNLVLESPRSAADVKSALERRLAAYAGKPVGVVVRSAEELAAVLAANPFPDAPGSKVAAIFLDDPPPPDALAAARGLADEQVTLGLREIYVHYPSGMGDSKLRIPAAQAGTARNMNTVAKLAEMASER